MTVLNGTRATDNAGASHREMPQVKTQVVEVARKSGGRSKTIARLIPEVRESIPGLFDRMPAERVAEQFPVSKLEVIEEVLRHTRRELGFGPRPVLSVARKRVAA